MVVSERGKGRTDNEREGDFIDSRLGKSQEREREQGRKKMLIMSCLKQTESRHWLNEHKVLQCAERYSVCLSLPPSGKSQCHLSLLRFGPIPQCGLGVHPIELHMHTLHIKMYCF